ncbi:Sec-independent protein translocase protein TatB [Acetobacteraceae bacterium KSS8]|uniref:Sec-independent protein translocase protein TatB n=1 Tax=Endosaccharibacter trunci TaxID=2812733 RepID=A0ABT1W7X4_9PROT|nr:Sec-independent protein translocase protein TatB [Acetobacteraceae bacterium KSS8]
MFGLDLSEFALIGIVALLFIGPKDMPVAIRTVTTMIKKGRKLAQEFQGHVDEMIREADLGEARDQFRQLRSLNVRGQVMRALDSDGSIRRTFQDDPFKTKTVDLPAMAAASAEPIAVEERPLLGTAPPDYPVFAEETPDPAEAADPAPSILPPTLARRLRAERAKPLAPRFVPPHAAGGLPAQARRP